MTIYARDCDYCGQPYVSQGRQYCSRKCQADARVTDANARFDKYVEPQENGCWNWIGAADKLGYGRFGLRGDKIVLAHRFSYERHAGPIPAGLTLDHLCRNPRCVNPAHLEPVTQRVNVARGASANKTHCRNGHPMTPENIAAWAARKGHKTCRVCLLERQKRNSAHLNAKARERRRKA